MSSPLDMIKAGITGEDWQLVCDGYNAMTGSTLLPPDSSPSAKSQKRGRSKKKTVQQEKRTQPSVNVYGKPNINKFVDTVEEAKAFYNSHPELLAERELARKQPKLPLEDRKQTKKIEGQCITCHAKVMVSPQYYDKYSFKCSGCLNSK